MEWLKRAALIAGVVACVGFAQSANAATIIGFDFTGTSSNQQPIATTSSQNSDLLLVSGVTGGTGLNAKYTSTTEIFEANINAGNAFDTNGTTRMRKYLQDALDAGLYVTFTIQAAPGYALNLTGISFDALSDDSYNHKKVAAVTSIEGFTGYDAYKSIGAITPGIAPLVTHTFTTSDTFANVSNSFPATEAYANITTPVEIRIAWHDMLYQKKNSLDNIIIEGSVVPVPEPAALAFLGVGAAGLLLRRRRAA